MIVPVLVLVLVLVLVIVIVIVIASRAPGLPRRSPRLGEAPGGDFGTPEAPLGVVAL